MSWGHWAGDRRSMGDEAVDGLQADYDRLLARYHTLVALGDALADEAGREVSQDPFRDRVRLSRSVKAWRSAR